MITKAQLEIFRLHWADENLLTREGSAAEQAAFVAGEWTLITTLIQDVRVLDSEMVPPAAAAEWRDRLERNTADEGTRQLLRQLAADWPRIRPKRLVRSMQWLLAAPIAALVFVVTGGETWSVIARQNRLVTIGIKVLLFIIFWLIYKVGTMHALGDLSR